MTQSRHRDAVSLQHKILIHDQDLGVEMDRRTLLRSIVAGAAVSGDFLPKFAFAQECPDGLLRGMQLYSVDDLLVSDARAALSAVGELGFRNVEFFDLDSPAAQADNFFGLSSREFAAAISMSGLRMKHAHIGSIWEDTDSVARIADKLGIEVLILGAAEEFYDLQDGNFNPKPATDLVQLDRLALRLNETGRRYRQLGFSFGYHNHWSEFIPIEGKIPLDFLIENTDPDNFKLELDLAWLTVAGLDPAAYLRRHANRVISCHMKDFDDRIELPESPTWSQYIEASIVEPGSGSMNFEMLLDVLTEIGLEYAFIEIDESSDPMAAIERGMHHLLSLRGC